LDHVLVEIFGAKNTGLDRSTFEAAAETNQKKGLGAQ